MTSSSLWSPGAPPLLPPAATASSLPFRPLFSVPQRSPSVGLQKRRLEETLWRISSSQRGLIIVNANASRSKASSSNDILMVDPMEAKLLAAKQMQEIQAKEKFKRGRQAEAINGALAMIGLTAALVGEAQTGKGILGQLASYWAALTGFFAQ